MNKEPVRIIEGSAKPYERFWNLRAAEDSESGEPEIEFYGPISEYSWWGDEITPSLFKEDLEKHGKGGPVTIRIHSPGGDVFAASAIRAMIMDYPGKVTTRIDGLCASAATYVAMAGDHVVMQDSAFFMIHDPWTVTIGGVEELKTTINFLKTIKDGIVETYQNKTHLEAEEIAKMMSNETWMTAASAKEMGFVDEVVSQPAVKAFSLQNVAVLNCLKSFNNVPKEVMMDEAELKESNTEDEVHTSEVDEKTLELEAEEVITDEDPASAGVKSEDDEADQSVDVSVPAVDEPVEQVDETDDQENTENAVRELGDYLDIFGPKR